MTHDLSTAARFAQRIAVIYLGRIVEEGPAEAVVRNPPHPYTKALISVVPRRDPRDRRQPQILVAIDRCSLEDPALGRPASAEAGHRAACLLLPGGA